MFLVQNNHGLPLCTWWRPCGNYHRLNLVTTPDKYPLPNMQDLFNGLHGCTVFSKIDLVKGYHQLPVATGDIPKTAIITLSSLFEYLFTPFGLSNTAQMFQIMMDRATNGWRVCLQTRTTHGSVLRTGKHTSPSGGFFHIISHQWPCHQLGKMCFCGTFS